MLNTSRLPILLLAASVAAGCAGPQTSSAVIPEPSQPSAFVEPNAGPDGAAPDSGVGVARFRVHDGQACGYIASDEAGSEWYGTCYNYVDKARLVAFDESTHSVHAYKLPDAYQAPNDIAVGPNRHGLWFTDPRSNRLGYLRFSDHSLKTWDFSKAHGLYGLTAGADNAVWFAEPNDHKIGRIDMRGFTIKQYRLADADFPDFMVLGRDNAVWFIDSDSVIGRITPTGIVTRYQLSNEFHITAMTTGPDGAMWFCGHTTTRSFVGRIDLYTHKRVIYSYKSGASRFMVARDSEIWMADIDAAEVDSFSVTDHNVIKFRLPRGISPYGIALGADNELYLDDNNHSWVTKVCPDQSSRQCAKSR